MNQTLLRSALVFVPVAILLGYTTKTLVTRRTAGSALQFVGATCLVVVVLAHVAEGLALFPSMRWGQPTSVGHYIDLSSAILGLLLVPTGYLIHRRSR